MTRPDVTEKVTSVEGQRRGDVTAKLFRYYSRAPSWVIPAEACAPVEN
jgi:hypothetical protein